MNVSIGANWQAGHPYARFPVSFSAPKETFNVRTSFAITFIP
jgi:hypothetical protein